MDIERTDDPSYDDELHRDDFLDDEDPYGYRELEDLRAIPDLRRPEDMPPVRSQADLHRHWRALMGELGFGQSRLYLQFFTVDGSCTPVILDITELPDLPDADMADALMSFCDQTLQEVMEPGTRVAILYARPGGRSPRTTDLAWARFITEAARRHGVPIHPVHVANDEELGVVTPDELARPA